MKPKEVVSSVAFTQPTPEFNRWRQKAKQRAFRALKAAHLDEFERLELQAQLDLWDERPTAAERQKGMRILNHQEEEGKAS